jgi:mannan endo-1,4-beta-mannosidase
MGSDMCVTHIILMFHYSKYGVATRRQEDLQAVGPAYDGSYGIDSQDIANIPNMDFGSFQYFPDQNKYGPDDPNLTPFENVVNTGNEWIRQQGEVSST